MRPAYCRFRLLYLYGMMAMVFLFPKNIQTTKASISDALSGLQKQEDSNGIHIYKVKGWDYAGMCEAFEEGIRVARETHAPVLISCR